MQMERKEKRAARTKRGSEKDITLCKTVNKTGPSEPLLNAQFFIFKAVADGNYTVTGSAVQTLLIAFSATCAVQSALYGTRTTATLLTDDKQNKNPLISVNLLPCTELKMCELEIGELK